jgi:hypothetical protein
MANGQIVAAGIPSGPPTGAITKLMASNEGKFTVLDVTEDELAKMDGGRNLWVPYTIAAGTYPGQDKDINTIAQPNFLAVNASVDENHVYLLTKTMYENLGFLHRDPSGHQGDGCGEGHGRIAGEAASGRSALLSGSRPGNSSTPDAVTARTKQPKAGVTSAFLILAASIPSPATHEIGIRMNTSEPTQPATAPIDERAFWLSEMPTRGNPLRLAVVGFAVCFALWHIATNIWLNEPGKWQNAIHFAGFAFLAAVTMSPFGRNSSKAGRLRLIFFMAGRSQPPRCGSPTPKTVSMSARLRSRVRPGNSPGWTGLPAVF